MPWRLLDRSWPRSRFPRPDAPRRSGGGAVANTGNRQLTVKVKSARGRKNSSTRWLQRQLNDPYVAEARARGLRSRAAFKLLELDDRFHFLRPGQRVIDLGPRRVAGPRLPWTA